MDTVPAPQQPAPPKPKTFLALGDSYTIGESVPVEDQWVTQLVGLLAQEQIPVSLPDIVARTGWTTAELMAALAAERPKGTFDLVSLLIGVNNQYRGQSVEQYQTEFHDLLQTAIGFAQGDPGRVLVLSIPDWGVTPFAQNKDRDRITREINTFNGVARKEAQKLEIAFVDITPVSRTAVDNLDLVAADNLHFSGLMYRLWAIQALPIAKNILRP